MTGLGRADRLLVFGMEAPQVELPDHGPGALQALAGLFHDRTLRSPVMAAVVVMIAW
jgi:hypothetical protein